MVKVNWHLEASLVGPTRQTNVPEGRLVDLYYLVMYPNEQLRLSLERDNNTNDYHLGFYAITES
jgi:hypothetical protein